MKCIYHPDTEAVSRCAICRKPICSACDLKENDSDHVCINCAGKQYHKDVVEQKNSAEQKRSQPKSLFSPKTQMILIALILVGLVVIIYTQREIPPEPFNPETATPAELAQYCILNLDEMAFKLKSVDKIDESHVKPFCAYPLIPFEEDMFISIDAPDPTSYGFTHLRINRVTKVLYVE